MSQEFSSVLQTGALFIAITMTFFWVVTMRETARGSRSRLLADIEPLCLWMETRTVRAAINQNRNKTLFFVFLGFGSFLWIVVAVFSLVTFAISPDLFHLLSKS